MRKLVTFPAILRGEGQEAECTIAATEGRLPGTSESAFCDYTIQKASKTLLEGRYQLFARGDTINIRRCKGNWLAEL